MSSDLFIGIDLGGTNLRFSLVDRTGTILFQERTRTEIDRGLAPLVEKIVAGVATLTGEAALRSSAVAGIGVGVPGLIAPNGFINASVNLPPLEGINLREILERRTGQPVQVLNDANAFAVGEAAFGAGSRYSSFLMLTLGTGVGGGLILNRRLWTGADGAAGEFGHVTVYPDGRPCKCGNRGCLEQYASASAIVAFAVEAIARGRSTSLAALFPDKITAGAVAEAAAAGDEVAREIYSVAGRAIGVAAASTANFLNIDALLLSGGVAASFELLASPLRQEVARRAFPTTASRLEVVRGRLGEEAGVLGSAAAAMGMLDLE